MEKMCFNEHWMSNLKTADHHFLTQLIKETSQFKGGQYPNPVVGAMVVENGAVVSTGFHQCCGSDHAEVIALKKAGKQADGATLYVTLEPCVHEGKTPPCVNAIIESNIAKVVWAVNDPNPVVAGKAANMLTSAGIQVVENASPDLGGELIKEFAMVHQHQRPYVVAKVALSLDGKLAPHRQKRVKLSSNASMQWVQRLRKYQQAIIVGWRTCNVDHPQLRCHELLDNMQPMIGVIDPNGALCNDWLLATLNKGRQVIVFSHQSMDLTHVNLTVVSNLPFDARASWEWILQTLYETGVHGVLVEGGGGVITSLLKSNCYDEFLAVMTPNCFGETNAVGLVTDACDVSGLQVKRTDVLDSDVLIQYKNTHAFRL